MAGIVRRIGPGLLVAAAGIGAGDIVSATSQPRVTAGAARFAASATAK